jgi:hypothetical protein
MQRRVAETLFPHKEISTNGKHRNYLTAFYNCKALKKGKVMGNYQSV